MSCGCNERRDLHPGRGGPVRVSAAGHPRFFPGVRSARKPRSPIATGIAVEGYCMSNAGLELLTQEDLNAGIISSGCDGKRGGELQGSPHGVAPLGGFLWLRPQLIELHNALWRTPANWPVVSVNG